MHGLVENKLDVVFRDLGEQTGLFERPVHDLPRREAYIPPPMAVLTDTELETFAERGCVRLRGAFPEQLASRFRDEMWAELAREFGVDRGDPTTWHLPPGRGLRGVKKLPLQKDVATARLCGALDELLGEGTWRVPKQWGGVLVKLPRPGEGTWELPADVWHFDSRLGANVGALHRMFVFTVFAPLAEHGGATLALEGSPRLLSRFHDTLSEADRERKHRWHRQQFMKWDPWLETLVTPNEPENRVDYFMGRTSTVQGVPARVRELTGEPGDAWLCHPLMLHCGSPCVGAAPRFMMAKMVSPKGEQGENIG